MLSVGGCDASPFPTLEIRYSIISHAVLVLRLSPMMLDMLDVKMQHATSITTLLIRLRSNTVLAVFMYHVCNVYVLPSLLFPICLSLALCNLLSHVHGAKSLIQLTIFLILRERLNVYFYYAFRSLPVLMKWT